jgi:hypothetical protein
LILVVFIVLLPKGLAGYIEDIFLRGRKNKATVGQDE